MSAGRRVTLRATTDESGSRHLDAYLDDDGDLVSDGGRVLGVTALADNLQSARDLANAACDEIRFDGAFYRRDIGLRMLAATASR